MWFPLRAVQLVREQPTLASVLQRIGGILGLSGLLCCQDLTKQPLPAGTSDPSTFNTPAGALGMYNAAIVAIESALPKYFVDTGLLTDELMTDVATQGFSKGAPLDARVLPEVSLGFDADNHQDYEALQQARGSIAQALGALAAYDTVRADTARVKIRRAELYALAGYTELLLADFFCSGVPLSTLDFQNDFTYHASSTTAQVYHAASANADSALALDSLRTSASDSVLVLARVIKGRALLALDSVAAAAQVVVAVPNGSPSQYRLAVQWNPGNSEGDISNVLSEAATVSDMEGGNGLPFLSSMDPRTTVTVLAQAGASVGVITLLSAATFPTKYSLSGFSPVPVADWIEARLIQAEAALRATPNNPAWLTILNELRATAPIPGTTQAATPQQLPVLTDPGDSSARVSLLFRERAYWLFLTGHRQGDLRRLIRQYGRSQDHVYPAGLSHIPGFGRYGADVTAPIPATERANPLFHGCLNRDA